jgi:hypothetical protein
VGGDEDDDGHGNAVDNPLSTTAATHQKRHS